LVLDRLQLLMKVIQAVLQMLGLRADVMAMKRTHGLVEIIPDASKLSGNTSKQLLLFLGEKRLLLQLSHCQGGDGLGHRDKTVDLRLASESLMIGSAKGHCHAAMRVEETTTEPVSHMIHAASALGNVGHVRVGE